MIKAHYRLRGVVGKPYFEFVVQDRAEFVSRRQVERLIRRLRGERDRVHIIVGTVTADKAQRLRLAEYLETVLASADGEL